MELTEPWHASNRIVVADSAFASVNTAVQLNKQRMGFIGVVKTATKRFPLGPLQDTVLPSKGQYTGMATCIDNATLMAYVWSDRNRRYFIATAGSMAQGQPYQRIRWTEIGDEDGERLAERLIIRVPMPRASQLYFDACGMIDSHNRIREICGIEKRVRTHEWSTRVNLGILSMMYVDAYLLYKACCGTSAKLDPKKFFEQLAGEMLCFKMGQGTTSTTTRGKRKRDEEMLAKLNKGVVQEVTKRTRKNKDHARQGRCIECKKSYTTLVCSRCSCLKKKRVKLRCAENAGRDTSCASTSPKRRV